MITISQLNTKLFIKNIVLINQGCGAGRFIQPRTPSPQNYRESRSPLKNENQ